MHISARERPTRTLHIQIFHAWSIAARFASKQLMTAVHWRLAECNLIRDLRERVCIFLFSVRELQQVIDNRITDRHLLQWKGKRILCHYLKLKIMLLYNRRCAKITLFCWLHSSWQIGKLLLTLHPCTSNFAMGQKTFCFGYNGWESMWRLL